MKHYYKDIPGWFNFEDLYERIVRMLKDGSHIVEVGAWKGKSTSFLAVEIINSGKHITLDVVDTFKGSDEWDGYLKDPDIIAGTVYERFCENTLPVDDYINTVWVCESVEAAMEYEDKSLDFVFIDGCHAYESVKADILAWLPKVKEGGILAGHDYDSKFFGVYKAVNELLGPIEIMGKCWWYENISR